MSQHTTQGEIDEPPARILVIDDEEVVHVSLRRILGRKGHQVQATLSAPQALVLLESQPFDLIITDLMMPEMNGLELLEELRGRGIALPVLMITGYPTIKTALQALRLGAVDYLAKPFTRTELLSPVSRALRRSRASRDSDPPSLVPPPSPSDPESSTGQPPDTSGLSLRPGDRFRLRRHSWVTYCADGTVEAGIESSFLAVIGPLVALELPEEQQTVEQGYVGLRLTTANGEVHGVLMPLSGHVVGVNHAAAATPSSIDPTTWLIRLLPHRLLHELPLLVRG